MIQYQTFENFMKNSMKMRMFFVCITVMIMSLIVADTALAQQGRGGGGRGGGMGMGGGGGGGMGARFGPQQAFDAREIKEIIETLKLDDSQAEMINAMFEGYQSAYRDGRAANQEEMTKLREEMGPDNDWQAMIPRFTALNEQWNEESKQMETGFIEDLKNILTDKQLERWPRYEQDKRRRQSLGRRGAQGGGGFGGFGGGFPGENVDIIDMVDKLEWDTETMNMVEPILDQYVNEIDRAIVARDNLEQSSMGMMMGRFSGQDNNRDPQEIQKAMEDAQKKREDLQNINTRYCRTLAGMLDPIRADQLIYEFQKICYPRIYRPTPAERYAESIRKLDNLNDTQKQTLDAVMDNYKTRVEVFNRQLIEVEKKREQERQEMRQQMMQRFMSNGGPPDREEMRSIMQQRANQEDPATAIRNDKSTFISETVNSMFEILTPDQQQALPKPEVNPEPDQRQQWRQGQGGQGQQQDQQGQGGGRGRGNRGGGN